MNLTTETAKEISPNLRYNEDGWYMFVEGERVRTPRGTGFVTAPLKPLGPEGWTYCNVELDGHEDEEPALFTCSINNTDRDAISIE